MQQEKVNSTGKSAEKKFVIRVAREQDIKAMAALDILCFADPWSEEAFFREITENRVALYLVAEADEMVVGYAGVWLVAGEGHITNVAVHPHFRRGKIGEELMDVMLKISGQNGVWHHTLEVRESNQAAAALYRKLGFTEAGLRKNYYADNGENAVIMNRDIPISDEGIADAVGLEAVNEQKN